MTNTLSTGRAVVIGSSMGGLLAARVLAGHYREVLVIERDRLPSGPTHRTGVPQGHHAHGLLARGLQILESLFPGLTEQLYAAGAVHGDVGETVRWFHHGRYHPAVAVGMEGLAVSRVRLEHEVRERVRGLPEIVFREQSAVVALCPTADGRGVAGVRVRGNDEREYELAADLVVDCSGRGSRMPAWLESLGFTAPPEERVPVNLGYATRVYQRERGDPRLDPAYVIASSPPAPETGVLLWQEHNHFIVTLGGYFGDHPPTDDAGFLAFARRLPAPELAELIATSTPVSAIRPFRYPASARRRYEQLRAFPNNLLVFGDALCSFNPIYGQGIAACALQALALDQCVQRQGAARWRTFFRAAATVIDTPWQLAVGNDLRFSRIEAPRPLSSRVVNWYVKHVHAAAQADARIVGEFLRVVNLVVAPGRLFAPSVMWRVFTGSLRSRRV